MEVPCNFGKLFLDVNAEGKVPLYCSVLKGRCVNIPFSHYDEKVKCTVLYTGPITMCWWDEYIQYIIPDSGKEKWIAMGNIPEETHQFIKTLMKSDKVIELKCYDK